MAKTKQYLDYHYGNILIGDVHPLYNNETKQWFLYYLKTGGQFESSLLVSKDLLKWKEKNLNFIGTPKASYYVVAVMPYKNAYYSWFGQQYNHVCSISNNKIDWTSDIRFDITVNSAVSKFGQRDPYVVYDEEKGCFYLVALSYLNSQKDCAITLKKTSDLANWEEETKVLIHFPNGLVWSNGEPECPQLMKINHRWYLFASLARKTMHHVGPLTYWIGDIDFSIEQVYWAEKEAHLLTSEDLCAAQLAYGKNRHYLFGWLPQQSFGSEWGGNLNFPLIVTSKSNGKLLTHFDGNCIKKARGICLYSSYNVNNIDFISEHFLLDVEFNTNMITVFEFNQPGSDSVRVILDSDLSNFRVCMSALNIECSSLKLPTSIFRNTIKMKMICCKDVIEINLNNSYTLHARINRKFNSENLIISDCNVENIKIYEFLSN